MRATIVITIDERTGELDPVATFCEATHQISSNDSYLLNGLLDKRLKEKYDDMRDALKEAIDQYRASLAAGVEAPKTADK